MYGLMEVLHDPRPADCINALQALTKTCTTEAALISFLYEMGTLSVFLYSIQEDKENGKKESSKVDAKPLTLEDGMCLVEPE